MLSPPSNQNLAFAQGNNATTIPTLTKVGEKEFYLLMAEIEIPDVDEEKLKVAGDAFSIATMIVNEGDKVTIHFYNVDPDESSVTIGAPYNIDKASGESAMLTFTADHEGIYQYYCKYHLPYN